MGQSIVDCLRIVEQELVLFAAFWFIVGAADELAVDLVWLWLRLSGRSRSHSLPRGYENRPLSGRFAVLVPAWKEPEVIGEMIAHTLHAWPQRAMTLYVGCYCNDFATLASAMAGAGADPRVRLVVHDRPGPTTKADCLNRLHRALIADEHRQGITYTGVVFHDAEDMVHPAALSAIDRALERFDFVQLPVRPEPQRSSRWVAGHYADEFTEAHAKTLVVRAALTAAIPAAGVGCGLSRAALDRLASQRAGEGEAGPFSRDSLTEDYELGLLLSRFGARKCFLRARDSGGELVATRAFFPVTLAQAVRQKTRWIHGIALQGWDRLGWTRRPVDVWMELRDRRGPLAAIVLAAAYLLIVVEGLLEAARLGGLEATTVRSPLVGTMIVLCFASFAWRAAWRFTF
ncbi:MAG: glycosyl transferase family protein, partial [Novosphingobium sp.]